ncbi:MAG: hypothetical protein ACYC35_03010 [Pirellulales bacterium]
MIGWLAIILVSLGAAEPAKTSDARTDSRTLLALAGIGEDQFGKLTDGQPLDAGQREILLRIMYRVRNLATGQIERWTRGATREELLRRPAASRGNFFRLSGRVVAVSVETLPGDLAERFEMPRYYRCDLVTGEAREPSVVFTPTVPRAWAIGKPIDERVGGFGLFLKLGPPQGNRPQPMFVAERIAWYPATGLGDLGMDVGLFDEVRDGAPILARERECFYQLLAAVGRANPRGLLDRAERDLAQRGQDLLRRRKELAAEGPLDPRGRKELAEIQRELRRIDAGQCDVAPLFNEPGSQHGRLVTLRGAIRRAIPVYIEDRETIERVGIDHYYQLEMFTDDSQGYPLIVCVRQLPPSMPTGAELSEEIRVAAFFFKQWSYRGETQGTTAGAKPAPRRLAPLLIGLEPVWYRRPPAATNPYAAAIAGGLFILALAGLWLVLWRSGRGDRRFRDRFLPGNRAPEPGSSLPRLDMPAESDITGGHHGGTENSEEEHGE